MSDVHPSERWMWGREAAIGTCQHWYIHHKVLRSAGWVSDMPYSCADETFARQEAEKMSAQKSSVDGRRLYREVHVTGPHVSWRAIWWKHAS